MNSRQSFLAHRARLAWTVSPLLLAVTALGRSSQNAGQTTYPLIGRSLLHLSNGTIGTMGAVAALVGVGCSIFIVGRTRQERPLALLAVGQVFGLAAYVLLALPLGRPGLWAAVVTLGAYGGLALPSLMTAIGSGPRNERARAMAVYALTLSTSLLIGPLVESAVLDAVGDSLRCTFAVLLPVPAVSTVLAVGIAVRHSQEVGGDAGASSRCATTLPHRGPESSVAIFSWRSASAFPIAVTAMLTYQVPFSALVAFGALLIRHTDGGSAANAELAFGVFFGVSLGTRAALAATANRRQRTIPVLILAVVCNVVGLGIVGATHSFLPLLVGMAFLGLPHGSNFPLASTMLAERLPRYHLARANGLLMAGNSMVTVIVPLACGWLAQSVGFARMFLLVEVPVVVLGVVLLAQVNSAGRLLRVMPDAPSPDERDGTSNADPRI